MPLLRGEAAAGLKATTIIEWLEERFPGRYSSAPCNVDYKTGEHCTDRSRKSTSPRNIRAGREARFGGSRDH